MNKYNNSCIKYIYISQEKKMHNNVPSANNIRSTNNISSHPRVYSIKNILESHNTNNQPYHNCHRNDLHYRRIIEEIKSPLQEQSFLLTNDNSYNIIEENQEAENTRRKVKRPNIPPAPIKSPILSQNNKHFLLQNQFSRSHQSMNEISIYQHLSQNNTASARFHKISSNHQNYPPEYHNLESIVSPLMLNNDVDQKHQGKQDLNQSNGIFCGGVFDDFLQKQNQVFISLPERRYNNGQRRKIFQKITDELFDNDIPQLQSKHVQKSSINPSPKQNNKEILLIDSIKKMQEIGEEEIAFFLTFIQKLNFELLKLQKHKYLLEQNAKDIYELLAEDEQLSNSEFMEEINLKYYQVFNRVKAKNTFEVLQHIKNSEDVGNKRGETMKKEQVQAIIKKLFQILKGIEDAISEFAKSPNFIRTLKTIAKFLNSNFPTKNNLYEQLVSLMHSLQIFEVDSTLINFSLIWPKFSRKRYSEQEFLQSVCENEIICNVQDEEKEDDLKIKGFSKNI